jgi:hypothetical protein
LRRNCVIIHVIEGEKEGRIEMTVKWGKRRKQLRHVLKKTRGYCQLKEEALYRTCFGKGYGPVVRQITEWMTLKIVRVCDLASSSLSSKDSHRRERDGRENSSGNKFKPKPSLAI